MDEREREIRRWVADMPEDNPDAVYLIGRLDDIEEARAAVVRAHCETRSELERTTVYVARANRSLDDAHAELAALRALLELRTRERDAERAKAEQARKAAIEECLDAAEGVRGGLRGEYGEYDGDRADDGVCAALAAIRALLNTKGNDHER